MAQRRKLKKKWYKVLFKDSSQNWLTQSPLDSYFQGVFIILGLGKA